MTTRNTIEQLAERLAIAERNLEPIEPIREILDSVEDAYAVQAAIMNARESHSNPLIGRKVGLTSPAVQAQLGVDQPDYGRLLADMLITDGAIRLSELIQPKIEAEIAFLIKRDVLQADRETLVASIEAVAPSFEIVDSRIKDWRIGFFDTVADNASSSRFILGESRVDPSEIDLAEVEMRMLVNGEELSRGAGRDCLGDPLNALQWVAEMSIRQGIPLRGGEWVLSGALGPMVALAPGMEVRAEFTGLGDVAATTKEG